jgi:cellulose synthase/poly-beta-1,6-N-acetylglucosamine synthase-like glycosyltransferase
VGIPAYNEENNIAAIITKLKKITNSIIVCDDGSSDMTAEISPSEMGMDISTEILIKASSKDLKISEVPILDIKERFK